MIALVLSNFKTALATVCPAGYRCDGVSSNTACTTGQYSLEGESACSSCPAGYRCPHPADTPAYCDSGTYSALGD